MSFLVSQLDYHVSYFALIFPNILRVYFHYKYIELWNEEISAEEINAFVNFCREGEYELLT
jgi:hypothetical protein